MYEINDYNLNDTPSRPLKIKYLEYLRHFDLTQGLVTLNSSKGDTLDVFPRLSQHVEQYELNYGKTTQHAPPTGTFLGPLSTNPGPWDNSLGRLHFFAHHQAKIHRATVERLDHPDPAMGLRKEKMERRKWIQSVLKLMKESPVLRQPVVALIRRLLANDDDDDDDDTGCVDETRLTVPSLQALSLHGYASDPRLGARDNFGAGIP
ncbi:hypothetical protein MVEG_05582 [Podila verticillata NRRL 6337]|nr:hypothetical protein MVEG_05582 [Podila verticillata NRRL 6337]